jgi:hypothetical protein
MDPFLRSKIRSGVSEVLLEMKEARLEELKKIFSENKVEMLKDNSTALESGIRLVIEIRLVEAEIVVLKRTVNCYSGSMGPL